MEGGEQNRKLVRERPAQERERVFVYVREVSEEQWLSQGAVIQERSSCRVAP